MGVQNTLSKLEYYKTLKQLNKAMFELRESLGGLPGYRSYINKHTNNLTKPISINF